MSTSLRDLRGMIHGLKKRDRRACRAWLRGELTDREHWALTVDLNNRIEALIERYDDTLPF